MANIEYDQKLRRYFCSRCGNLVPSEMVRQFLFCPMCGSRVFKVVTWEDKEDDHE